VPVLRVAGQPHQRAQATLPMLIQESHILLTGVAPSVLYVYCLAPKFCCHGPVRGRKIDGDGPKLQSLRTHPGLTCSVVILAALLQLQLPNNMTYILPLKQDPGVQAAAVGHVFFSNFSFFPFISFFFVFLSFSFCSSRLFFIFMAILTFILYIFSLFLF
jgi:hypothetical protein